MCVYTPRPGSTHQVRRGGPLDGTLSAIGVPAGTASGPDMHPDDARIALRFEHGGVFTHSTRCTACLPARPFRGISSARPKRKSSPLSLTALSADETRISPPRAALAMRADRMTFFPKK